MSTLQNVFVLLEVTLFSLKMKPKISTQLVPDLDLNFKMG